VHPRAIRIRILCAFFITRTWYSPKTTLFTGASVLWIPNCHREHSFWYVYSMIVFKRSALLFPHDFFFPFLLSLSFDTKAWRGWWRQGEE
jgi:hypothetical protein